MATKNPNDFLYEIPGLIRDAHARGIWHGQIIFRDGELLAVGPTARHPDDCFLTRFSHYTTTHGFTPRQWSSILHTIATYLSTHE